MRHLRRFRAQVKRGLWLDRATRRFVRHNRRIWPKVAHGDKVVLVDSFNVPQTTLAYSYLLNVLRRRHEARVAMVSVRPLHRMLPTYVVFRSFGVRGFVQPRRSRPLRQIDQAEAAAALQRVRSKADLTAFEIDGINIGMDVYESYLHRHLAGTVDLEDPRLREIMAEAVGYLRFWQAYLDRHRVCAAVFSHDSYVESNIICRLAYQRDIPVYTPWVHQMVRLDRPHAGSLRFAGYPGWFAQLDQEDRGDAVALAEARLTQRLGGIVSSVDLPYVEKSAFEATSIPTRLLTDDDRLKVLVCSHCFYDNPHAYGGMLFPDFYEWLDHLGAISKQSAHAWYVKTHPRPHDGSLEILRELLARHPHLVLLPADVSHHQLIAEGIDVVITCYGTVGEEYPALGVPVVNAGRNPRLAYDFNHHATTLAEYESLLGRLADLPRTSPGLDLYEFYFMHHVYTFADDLILDSYEGFAAGRSPAELESSLVYDHFLDRFDPSRHARSVERVREFVESGARFLFSRGPVSPPSDDLAG